MAFGPLITTRFLTLLGTALTAAGMDNFTGTRTGENNI